MVSADFRSTVVILFVYSLRVVSPGVCGFCFGSLFLIQFPVPFLVLQSSCCGLATGGGGGRYMLDAKPLPTSLLFRQCVIISQHNNNLYMV